MKKPPKYALHKPTGQARVILNGKHHYLGVYGTPESVARYAALLETLATPPQPPPTPQPTASVESSPPPPTPQPTASVESSPPPPTTRPVETPRAAPTVTVLIDEYWRRHALDYYPAPSRRNLGDTLRFLREHCGELPALEFGPKRLKELRERMIARGWTRNYINTNVGRICRMFRWCASEELIPVTIADALKTISGLRRGRTAAREGKKVRPVDDAVVDATLPHLPDVVRAMVKVQRLTGMRPAELCKMRGADIDRSGEVWLYRIEEHKTAHHGDDHTRTVAIGPQAQAILAPLILRAGDGYTFSPKRSEADRNTARREARKTKRQPSHRIGARRKRNPQRPPADCYTPTTYRRAVERAATLAGVERWTPHRLRHSFATRARRELSIEHSRAALGHSDATITATVYAERDENLARETALRLG